MDSDKQSSAANLSELIHEQQQEENKVVSNRLSMQIQQAPVSRVKLADPIKKPTEAAKPRTLVRTRITRPNKEPGSSVQQDGTSTANDNQFDGIDQYEQPRSRQTMVGMGRPQSLMTQNELATENNNNRANNRMTTAPGQLDFPTFNDDNDINFETLIQGTQHQTKQDPQKSIIKTEDIPQTTDLMSQILKAEEPPNQDNLFSQIDKAEKEEEEEEVTSSLVRESGQQKLEKVKTQVDFPKDDILQSINEIEKITNAKDELVFIQGKEVSSNDEISKNIQQNIPMQEKIIPKTQFGKIPEAVDLFQSILKTDILQSESLINKELLQTVTQTELRVPTAQFKNSNQVEKTISSELLGNTFPIHQTNNRMTIRDQTLLDFQEDLDAPILHSLETPKIEPKNEVDLLLGKIELEESKQAIVFNNRQTNRGQPIEFTETELTSANEIPSLIQVEHSTIKSDQIVPNQSDIQSINVTDPDIQAEQITVKASEEQTKVTQEEHYTPFQDSSEDELDKKDEKLELLRERVAKKVADLSNNNEIQLSAVESQMPKQEVQQIIPQDEVQKDETVGHLSKQSQSSQQNFPQRTSFNEEDVDDREMRLKKSTIYDESLFQSDSDEFQFKLSSNYFRQRQRQKNNEDVDPSGDGLDILDQIEKLEMELDDPFAQLGGSSSGPGEHTQLIPTHKPQDLNLDQLQAVPLQPHSSRDRLISQDRKISSNGGGRTSSSDGEDNLQKTQSTYRQANYNRRGFKNASNPGVGVAMLNRMTLKDFHLQMTEENSDLESEEDQDKYLEQLLEEERRIKLTQIQLEQIYKVKKLPDNLKEEKGMIERKSFYLDPQNSDVSQASIKLNNVPRRHNIEDIIEEQEGEDQEDQEHNILKFDSSQPGYENQVFPQVSNEDEDERAAQEEYIELQSTLYRDVIRPKNDRKLESGDIFGDIEKAEKEDQRQRQGLKYISHKDNKPEIDTPKVKNDYEDLMLTIDWNERRYQDEAKASLKKNSILQNALQNSDSAHKQIRTRIVSNFATMNSVTNKLTKDHQLLQAQSTCVGLSDSLVMIGNSEGKLQLFDRENEQYYATFSEKSKEFIGNAVTAIDIHPLRPEYVVIGFANGQLVLLDVVKSPTKSLKVIKDSNRNVPIINARFADWSGPQGKLYNMVQKGLKDNKRNSIHDVQDENQQNWMIVSIDADGFIFVSTVVKIMIMYKVSRHLVIDPMKSNYDQFSSMATRFQSTMHGTGLFDHQAIVTIANKDCLVIFEARQNEHRVFGSIKKPEKYYNKRTGNFNPFLPLCVPALSWGEGMSPVLKDRPHSILAIGWGPVVQLAVLIDHEEIEKPIIMDGFHIIRCFDTQSINLPRELSELTDPPEKDAENEEGNQGSIFNIPDEFDAFHLSDACYIEALYFLSDSTILVLLSGQEMRILDTQSFRPEAYDPDRIVRGGEKHLSKRATLQIGDGNTLFPEELEIGIRCARMVKSEQGKYSSIFPMYQQTLKYFRGKFVGMTNKGIQTCSHLTWQQSIYDFQKNHKIRTTQRASQAIQDSESKIDLDEQEDLTQVFLRALEIYKGKIKGYQGLTDNEFLRESLLRAELKLFVKEVIQQLVEEASNQAVQMIDDLKIQGSQKEYEQFQQDRQKKFSKIVRIAIEFCIELKDCDFLFKDLCWLFQDFGGQDFELLFIKELEQFILAGKFTEWQLPLEVLEGYIGRYYMSEGKGDKFLVIQSPETFEKVIVNLNLSQCSKDQVLNFIKYSEQHFLTTAIISLYTQLFERKDNASCVQVLFSLYDLYRRATDQQKSDATILDLQKLREMVKDQSEFSKIEKSQVYLGYKLFWFIKLILNGKKFPNGNIKEQKWRSYVHDILQFLSNPEILRDLAQIDSETLFQVISVLFLRTSKPFELVMQGRDEGQVSFGLRFNSHWEFLQDMDACFMQLYKEQISSQSINHYLIFIANLVAKDRDLSQGLPHDFFFRVTRELLKNYKAYMQFNKNLQDRVSVKKTGKPGSSATNDNLQPNEILSRVSLLRESNRMTLSNQLIQHQLEEAAKQVAEEVKYVQKTENDILNLLRRSEPLDSQQTGELLQLVEQTQLFEQVQLYLLEQKEDYIRCLQLLLREADRQFAQTLTGHTSVTMRDQTKLPIAAQLLLMNANDKKGERIISWLSEKIGLLEARLQQALDDNSDPDESERKLKALKQESLTNLSKLLKMSRIETVHFVEVRLQGNHQLILQQIRKDTNEQLLYLDTLLDTLDQQITDVIKSYTMNSNQSHISTQARTYLELIILRLRLTCQLKPERVFGVVEGMVRKGRAGVFPIEECLKVCEEYKQVEACFLLNKKLGKYYESVNQGLQIVKSKISLSKLKVELYFAKKNNIVSDYCITSTQLSEIYFFDAIFKRILKILVKHGKEVDLEKEEQIWYQTIDALLDLKQEPSIFHKAYCRRFFQQRLNILVEEMARTIPFNKFLDHALARYQETQFKEFQEIILHVVWNQNSEENVLTNANMAISKVNQVLFDQFSKERKHGLVMRAQICFLCKKYLDKKLIGNPQFMHNEEDDKDIEEALDDQDQDPMNDELAKVFACGHTYHFHCLRRHQKKRNPGSDLRELQLRVGCNRLKCPICNINNLDLDDAQDGILSSTSRQNNRRVGNNQMSSSEDAHYTDYLQREQRKQELRLSKRESLAQSQMLRELDRMRRRMIGYESDCVDKGLTLTDFLKVKQQVSTGIIRKEVIESQALEEQRLNEQRAQEAQLQSKGGVNPMLRELEEQKKKQEQKMKNKFKAVGTIFKTK